MTGRLAVVAALALAAAPAPAADPPAPRALHAAAVHRHGSCEPLPANSPGGHGARRTAGGDLVLEASARHPFAVGHHLDLGGAHAALWLRRAPHRLLGLSLPLSACPR